MRILFFSDNRAIYQAMRQFADAQPWGGEVDYACSPGTDFAEPIRIKDRVSDLAERYRLIVSGHCKQIFPAELVEQVSCVNLHPGYNPETRGWYPQVPAIIHGRTLGYTVHLMDAAIDHGAIIYRAKVDLLPWDTSKSAYDRVLAAEIESLPAWLPWVVFGNFSTFEPEGEGHYTSKQDFAALCEFDREEVGTFGQFYDRLRATSFAPFRNAWLRDAATGKRIFVRLEVEPDESN